MKARVPFLKAIRDLKRPVFTTREIAILAGTSMSSASQSLGRLANKGLVVRARQGLWCDPDAKQFTPFSLVPYLSGEHQAYVSFVSALYLHGIIEQIPVVIYASTTGHSRRITTPIGTYSFHQIAPTFFDGFDWYGNDSTFLCATKEKALVDCLYLSFRKNKRFGNFPELRFPRNFSTKRARNWLRRIDDPRLRTLVSERLDDVLAEHQLP